MRRTFLATAADVGLLAFATVLAFALRFDFQPTAPMWSAFAPYFATSIVIATGVFPLLRLDRTIWRYSAMADYVRIVMAVTCAIIVTVFAMFLFNRLDGVARSLPFLQAIVGTTLLVGARVLLRMRRRHREQRGKRPVPLRIQSNDHAKQHIIVVGLNQLTALYLRSIEEFGTDHVEVVGILGHRDRHVGSFLRNHEVLGTPEDLANVIDRLAVHGVLIERVVVTVRLSELSDVARGLLVQLERDSAIRISWIDQQLGLSPPAAVTPNRTEQLPTTSAANAVRFQIPTEALENIARRPYWHLKRAIDVGLALLLLACLWPAIAVVAVVIVLSHGWPVTFWQQRPGLAGRPFRVRKFRTMRPARGPDGQRLDDDDRVTPLGKFLRRTRLDELPQLVSILRGEMSFVGPRPLLPRDQSEAYQARLLVRPGLTGWAQVVGGRTISAEDKAALDVWYVQNASLLLDARVLARTIGVVLFGERFDTQAINVAWRDLARTGVLSEAVEAAE